MKKFTKTNEFIVLLTVIALCLIIGTADPHRRLKNAGFSPS